jgi:hypothetical protein
MRENQSVSEMATEVLARQAAARVERTGEPLEAAFLAVLQTEAGRRLEGLREGEHRDESADLWQSGLPQERAEERRQGRLEERRRLREEEHGRARRAEWEEFVRNERRELELRKGGQLAELLGGALAGESAAALRRLAFEDRRQAEEGLVALMSQGKVHYRRLEELSEGDMAARIAAIRLRETWLKERRDGWLDYGGGSRGESRP